MASGATAPRRAAAFFDVDGTLVSTTIVHYYVYFRSRRLSPLWRRVWYAGFLAKCGYYLLLDKLDRSRMNVVFYRSYAGLPVAELQSQAVECHRDVIRPRCFAEGANEVVRQREEGRRVVLVTGSIDFIIAPLARELAVDHVLAASLRAANGRFTGELDGPPIGSEEKARRIRRFAEGHDIDLAASHAYGDSIADLPMLETVGHPHVVNADKALAAAAERRGWPAHRWATPLGSEGNGR